MSETTARTITITCTGLAESMEQATEEIRREVAKAISSALNKMTAQLKTLASSEILQSYNVPRKILNERMNVFRARMNDLEAEIVFSGKSIPLPYFGAKQIDGRRVVSGNSKVGLRTTKRRGQRGFVGPGFSGGVEVQIKPGQTTVLRSAFIAQMKSGHVGVFRRGPGMMKARDKGKRTKHSAKIYEQAMVSIATMVDGTLNIREKLVARIDERLEAIFWHEFEFFTTRGLK